MTEYQDRLRRLAINDRRYLETVLGGGASSDGECVIGDLDARSCALARVSALVALDGPAPSFGCAISAALACGATPGEVVDVLVAIGPTVGSARLVSAAPKVALALGYDVADDLEGRRSASIDPSDEPVVGSRAH